MTATTGTPGTPGSTGTPAAIGSRGIVLYALASLALIGVAAGVFSWVYDGAARQAVLVSAAVAFVLQVLAFVIARLFAASGHAIAGWGLGAVVCLVSLVIYGYVCRALGMPSDAAMLSLATFYFLTEVIEPPFLLT